MLLLCQGVSGMRKDGEPAVWTHHKQSFQGESLTVNACPQLTTLIHISLSHASPNQSIRTICKFTPALSSTRGPAQPQIWTKGLKGARSKKKKNTTKTQHQWAEKVQKRLRLFLPNSEKWCNRENTCLKLNGKMEKRKGKGKKKITAMHSINFPGIFHFAFQWAMFLLL